MLKLTLSTLSRVALDATSLLVRLLVTVLLPLVVGKVLREYAAGVKLKVDKWNASLGFSSNMALFGVVRTKLCSSFLIV